MIETVLRRSVGLALLVLASGSSWAGEPEGPYRPTWESLSKHPAPEWFQDAKFGIYTHWGPITVATAEAPSGMEWYARQMYQPDHPAFQYHRERFGDQKTFGYKDVVLLFRAEKFDAEAWAELFARAGAKFAGPVVIHHDNFAMWDSAHTEWDSTDQGPRRDITGELEKAVRKRGLKFIATFHHAFAWQYYEPAYAYDAADPKHAGLYGPPHEPGTPPTQAYLDAWLAKVHEVVDKYQPDLIWFDFGLGRLIPPECQRRMFADYYNWAAGHGREVGVAHKHPDIHEQTGILDFERGREDRITPYVWLTDTSVGPWFHHECSQFKSADQLVDVLVDIVSKNGCMLLNVGPDADGTIPRQGRQLLLDIGQWLNVNGEAIYGTRPWKVFGEGPTRNKGGGFSERADAPYTSQDVRFTRSQDGKTLYAIVLDWPDEPLVIRSLKATGAGPGARVTLLGHDGKVAYRVSDEGQPVIDVPKLAPDQRPCRHAFAFKLTGFQLDLHPEACFSQPDAVRLEPEKATMEGTGVRLQTKGGRPSIGYWDNPADRVHWLAWIRRPGVYAVRGELSSAYGPSGLTLELAGQPHTAGVPKTDGWFKPVMVGLGRFRCDQPGVYHLVLQPADPARWEAVNVWQLQLAPAEAPVAQGRSSGKG